MFKKKKSVFGRILSLILLVIVIIVFCIIYRKYNYNNFLKNVVETNKTTFTRDSNEKISKEDSYKIESKDYNDAMFSQVVSVLPNRPYKVSCKVKVENVENLNETISGGAHICIEGTTERSNTINGTSDWQEVNFYFNSKNRTEVNIGFRLGGYKEKSKGTAWFSDLKMEAGTADTTNTWKIGCFIFPIIDVNVDVNEKKEHVKLEMTETDIADIIYNLYRYNESISKLSKNKIKVESETYTIWNPITTLSYDEENGYYVSASDVYAYINHIVREKQYDHIYVAFRMANKQKGNDVLVNDWIGLGGMDYFGIGFSNIRMPDDENSYAYQYNYLVNTFPEEVFVHEFLHTLERNSEEYGYEIPALHDYSKYGYTEDRTEGLKKWYEDYMNCNIDYNGKKIGLPSEIFTCKPAHEDNFTYSTELSVFKEPKNVIEVVRSLFTRVGRLFSYMSNKTNEIENINT